MRPFLFQSGVLSDIGQVHCGICGIVGSTHRYSGSYLPFEKFQLNQPWVTVVANYHLINTTDMLQHICKCLRACLEISVAL